MLLSWAMSFGILFFFGTVSRNMLMSWPISFGILLFGTVSRNMLISDAGEVAEALFFWFSWDCIRGL